MADLPAHGAAPPPLNPDEFIETLADLVHSGREDEAVLYARAHWEALYPHMTARQSGQFETLTETAVTLLNLKRWEREGFPRPRKTRDALIAG